MAKIVRLYIPAGFCRIDKDKINLSFIYGTAKYSLSIYKNGTFDYTYKNFLSQNKIEEKELKNSLIEKYNYDAIKEYVEKEDNSIIVSEYLHDMMYKFLESVNLWSRLLKLKKHLN